MAQIRGGDKIRERLENIRRQLERPVTVRVGFLEGASYPNGTPVAMIAAIQEYGAPSVGIPPRPFFRDMIAAKSREWGPAAAALLPANNYDAERVMSIVGQAIAGQLRESIQRTNSPPLAASTIRRKGFSKPLVDTGHMLNSVDFQVIRR